MACADMAAKAAVRPSFARPNLLTSERTSTLSASSSFHCCDSKFCVLQRHCEKASLRRCTRSPASTRCTTDDKQGYKTQVRRNANFAKLQAGYLFPEIARRRAAHVQKHPDAKVISLGIGDTTEPIPEVIAAAMEKKCNNTDGQILQTNVLSLNSAIACSLCILRKARGLSTMAGYSGYNPEQGDKALRAAIAKSFYGGLGVDDTEIFVSDGAKCDIARLQVLFGPNATMAAQDPSYPAYVDTSVIVGQTGEFQKDLQQYSRIQYMKCTPENNFFPDLLKIPRTDIIFFCSPNNPTGSAATKEELQQLVAFAKKNGSIIVFDSAYAFYMSEKKPKSVFEIPGAREVAIEFGSFSKVAGFTGVRLGWTVIPKELRFADGFPVIQDFSRVMGTCFNGASNIAQAGGLACLSPQGLKAMQGVVGFYKENTKILLSSFQKMGFKTFGGMNAPYVWVQFPGQKSWDIFAKILEKTSILTTPGTGFGPSGEGFLRFSAFGRRENVLEACRRLEEMFK